MTFSIKGFFSKCDQIRNFLRIWWHLLKKSLMENFIFLCSILPYFFRSSHRRRSAKKVVLRSFAKFIGKQLCQSLFFNKVAGLRLATVLKKRLWHRCFPLNFAKFLRTPFFIENLRWLLLFF